MSDKTISINKVKSSRTFDDQLRKSRTDSSTNMAWERDLNYGEDDIIDTYYTDNTFTTTEFPSRSFSASMLENPSQSWLNLSTPPRTVPRNKSDSKSSFGSGTSDKGFESSDGNETSGSTPRSYLSMLAQNSSSDGSGSVPAYNPDKICELTADLVEFCMELLFDYSQQKNVNPEAYVEKKFVYEYINMGDWEMIASIEVFYSCLEKAPILDLVIKGFKRSLGIHIFSKINQFEIIQMRVLSFLVLYESERIGVKVLETVLMRFTGQNVRRLYFFLSGQLNFESSLKTCIVNIKGEDYFTQLIGPNLVTSTKLMKKVPRAMHLRKRKQEGLEMQKKKKSIKYKTKKETEEGKPNSPVLPSEMTEPIKSEETLETGTSSGGGGTTTTAPQLTIENSKQDTRPNSGEINYDLFSPRETEIAIADIPVRSVSANLQEILDPETKVEEYLKKSRSRCQSKSNQSNIGKVLKGPTYRGKETVTTILRERQRLQNLLIKDSFGDYESALRSMEEKQKFQDIKAAEAKEEERKRKLLLLQSQLTFHRAIAAARDHQGKKQEVGNEIRREKEILRLNAEMERIQELEEKKKQAKLMAEQEMERIRKATEESLRQKQEIANRIKKENEELRLQSLKREKDEELQRLDTIRKIQAAHGPKPLIITASNIYHETLLRRVYNAKNTIRLGLSKLEQEQNLQNNKQRILDIKREKQNKIYNAQNEIELWRMTNNMKRSMERDIKQPEPELLHESEDVEIFKIKKELENLKESNKPGKSFTGNGKRFV